MLNATSPCKGIVDVAAEDVKVGVHAALSVIQADVGHSVAGRRE